MRQLNLAVLPILLAVSFTSAERVATPSATSSSSLSTSNTSPRIDQGAPPLSFEANRGQASADVRFIAHGPGYLLFLHPSGATLSLHDSMASKAAEYRDTELHLRLTGANPRPAIVGEGRLPGKANYFTGGDSRHWHTDIPTYARILYRNVYPGIDLIYYGSLGRLEFDWLVRPGASPRAIRLSIGGVRQLHVDIHGGLILHAGAGRVHLEPPTIFQSLSGKRHVVRGHYAVMGRNEVGLEIGAYDSRHSLVIDPILRFSTFIGSAGFTGAAGIAVDRSGGVYIVGTTDDPTVPGGRMLPVHTRPRDTYSVYISKLSPQSHTLLYTSYIGGTDNDFGDGISVDSDGNAYVTGATSSTDFPTIGAIQSHLSPCKSTQVRGCLDAFVLKLNPAGDRILYSTYLGGGLADQGEAIAVDPGGSASVIGTTNSINFPVVSAVQPAPGIGSSSCPRDVNLCNDAFIAKLSPSGDRLIYSTYFGGNGDERGRGIATDGTGAAYVTGETCPGPHNAPWVGIALVKALRSDQGKVCNSFVTKLTPSGTLIYSTYLGVSAFDPSGGVGIAVDVAGSAYITGSGRVDPLHPCPGSFVTKLSPTGDRQVYVMCLPRTAIHGIAVDKGGNASVTGDGAGLPLVDPLPQPLKGEDKGAFVAKLNAEGSSMVYSTYLIGGGYQIGMGIATSGMHDVYVTGITTSPDFPVVNPVQPYRGRFGSESTFVAILADGPSPPPKPLPLPRVLPVQQNGCPRQPRHRYSVRLPVTYQLQAPLLALAPSEREGHVFGLVGAMRNFFAAAGVLVLNARTGTRQCTITLSPSPGALQFGPGADFLPFSRSWTDSIVVDAQTRRAYVLAGGYSVNDQSPKVNVFDTSTGRRLHVIDETSTALALDQRTRRVFALHQRLGAFTHALVLDAASGLPLHNVVVAHSTPSADQTDFQIAVDEPRGHVFILDNPLRMLDATTGALLHNIPLPDILQHQDTLSIALDETRDRLFIAGGGGGCRGGPSYAVGTFDAVTGSLLRMTPGDCSSATLGPVDERAGRLFVVVGNRYVRYGAHTARVLDALDGRLVRDLSPHLGVPRAVDERTGLVYFVSGETVKVVEPRKWTVVRRIHLGYRADGILIEQRLRRVFIAGSTYAKNGAPLGGRLTILCADVRCTR